MFGHPGVASRAEPRRGFSEVSVRSEAPGTKESAHTFWPYCDVCAPCRDSQLPTLMHFPDGFSNPPLVKQLCLFPGRSGCCCDTEGQDPGQKTRSCSHRKVQIGKYFCQILQSIGFHYISFCRNLPCTQGCHAVLAVRHANDIELRVSLPEHFGKHQAVQLKAADLNLGQE